MYVLDKTTGQVLKVPYVPLYADVACPTCGAPEGKRCIAASGKRRQAHSHRVWMSSHGHLPNKHCNDIDFLACRGSNRAHFAKLNKEN